jgi:hypothetical protein
LSICRKQRTAATKGRETTECATSDVPGNDYID